MVKYYKPVLVKSKLMLEDINGCLTEYNPKFKSIVVAARKNNLAIRLPLDEKNIKLAGVVNIELFDKNRDESNER